MPKLYSFLILSLLLLVLLPLVPSLTFSTLQVFSLVDAAGASFTHKESISTYPATALVSCNRNIAETLIYCGTLNSTINATAYKLTIDPVAYSGSTSEPSGTKTCDGQYQSVSFDEETNLLWALCYDTSGNVRKFDGSSLAPVGSVLSLSFEITLYGTIMVTGGSYAYLISGASFGAKLYRVEKSDGAVIELALDGGGKALSLTSSLASSYDNNSIFVAMALDPGVVAKVNVQNSAFVQVGSIVTFQTLENTKAGFFQETMVCDQRFLYVCASSGPDIVKIDVSSFTYVTSLSVGTTDTMSIQIHPDMSLLFVNSPTDDRIKAIEIRSSDGTFQMANDDVQLAVRPYGRPVALTWNRVLTMDYQSSRLDVSCYNLGGDTADTCTKPTTTTTTTTTTLTPVPSSNDDPVGGPGSSSSIVSSDSSSTSLDTMAIVGIVIGVVAAVIIGVVVGVWLWSSSSSAAAASSSSATRMPTTTTKHSTTTRYNTVKNSGGGRNHSNNNNNNLQLEDTAEIENRNENDELCEVDEQGNSYFEGQDGNYYSYNGEEYFVFDHQRGEWIPVAR